MTLTQGVMILGISKVKVTVTVMLDLENILHSCCPWYKNVSWPRPKVIFPRSRSQCTHTQNLCPGHMLDLDNTSHSCCPYLNGMLWPWPKVISPRSRSQYTHAQNSCRAHNSSLLCCIWIIFHTVVDPRVCHDIDPRSYLQGQGHSAHIPNILCPGHNLSLLCWILIIFHTIVVHDPRTCHDLDTRLYL